MFKTVLLYIKEEREDGTYYVGKDFGLRFHFEIETQHIHGTEEEILLILNTLVSLKKVEDNLELKKAISSIKIDSELAFKQTLQEMKRIASLCGTTLQSNTFIEAYKEIKSKDFCDPGNYFYKYLDGKMLYNQFFEINKIIQSNTYKKNVEC